MSQSWRPDLDFYTYYPPSRGNGVAVSGPVAKDAAALALSAVDAVYCNGKMDNFQKLAQEARRSSTGELIDSAEKLRKILKNRYSQSTALTISFMTLGAVLLSSSPLLAAAPVIGTALLTAGIAGQIFNGYKFLRALCCDACLSQSQMQERLTQHKIIEAELHNRRGLSMPLWRRSLS